MVVDSSVSTYRPVELDATDIGAAGRPLDRNCCVSVGCPTIRTLSAVLNTSMSKHVIPADRKAANDDSSTGEANSDTVPGDGGKEGAVEARWLEGRYALCEQMVDGGSGSTCAALL